MNQKRKHSDIKNDDSRNNINNNNNKRNRHTDNDKPPMRPPPILRLMFGIPPYSLQDKFNEEHDHGNDDPEKMNLKKKKMMIILK